MITLGYLIEPLLIKKIKGEINIEISGIAYDSREVKEGDLFVCIKGYNEDGHNYANEAVDRGAKAIIVEKWIDIKKATLIKVSDSREALAILASQFYDCPTRYLNLIGVTGTNGKTTTAHLINSIYSASHGNTGLIGTVGYKIANDKVGGDITTPESLDLQRLMSLMVDRGVKDAVLEVSSHAIKQKRIVGCDFNICVFTNLSQDHLDYHASMEEYRAIKGRLFSFLGLKPKKNNIPKVAVINIDDENAEYMMQQAAVQIITYGIYNEADIRAKDIEIYPEGCRFLVESPWSNFELNLKITGHFSIYNALAAVTVALLEGFNPNYIKEGLEYIEKVEGRFEKVEAGQDFLTIIDYAHTPDSLENVLSTLEDFNPNRIGVVFGCGGDRDEEKRPIMGKVAAKYSDKLFITSDNPRTEDPLQIIEGIKEGIKDFDIPFIIEPDRKKAISEGINWASKGDVILIAGKGHESHQVFKDKVVDFDDRKVAEEEINKRLKNEM